MLPRVLRTTDNVLTKCECLRTPRWVEMVLESVLEDRKYSFFSALTSWDILPSYTVPANGVAALSKFTCMRGMGALSVIAARLQCYLLVGRQGTPSNRHRIQLAIHKYGFSSVHQQGPPVWFGCGGRLRNIDSISVPTILSTDKLAVWIDDDYY